MWNPRSDWHVVPESSAVMDPEVSWLKKQYSWGFTEEASGCLSTYKVLQSHASPFIVHDCAIALQHCCVDRVLVLGMVL